MAAQPQYNPVSEAIAQALEGVDPSRGQRTAFDLARALRGVIARHKVNAGPNECKTIITWYADQHGIDPEELFSEVYLAWDAVLIPEGVDPVTAAVMAATQEALPEAFFEGHPVKVRRLLWVVLGIARHLSGNGARTFFVSARKLGEALQRDAMTANRALVALCNSGYLQRVGYSTKTRAQRYRFCYRGTEELKNT